MNGRDMDHLELFSKTAQGETERERERDLLLRTHGANGNILILLSLSVLMLNLLQLSGLHEELQRNKPNRVQGSITLHE